MLVVLGFALAFTSGLFATDQSGKLNGSDVSMMKLAAPPSAPTNKIAPPMAAHLPEKLRLPDMATGNGCPSSTPSRS
jgi:hypothetical protein